jgi:phospholipid-transporting ATPase
MGITNVNFEDDFIGV